jgi:hypothetical protein
LWLWMGVWLIPFCFLPLNWVLSLNSLASKYLYKFSTRGSLLGPFEGTPGFGIRTMHFFNVICRALEVGCQWTPWRQYKSWWSTGEARLVRKTLWLRNLLQVARWKHFSKQQGPCHPFMNNDEGIESFDKRSESAEAWETTNNCQEEMCCAILLCRVWSVNPSCNCTM